MPKIKSQVNPFKFVWFTSTTQNTCRDGLVKRIKLKRKIRMPTKHFSCVKCARREIYPQQSTSISECRLKDQLCRYGMFNPSSKNNKLCFMFPLLLFFCSPDVVSKWCSLIFFHHPLLVGKEVSSVPDVRGFFLLLLRWKPTFPLQIWNFFSLLWLSRTASRMLMIGSFPQWKSPPLSLAAAFVVAVDEAFFIHDKLSVLLSRATSGEGRSFFELSSALSVYIFK